MSTNPKYCYRCHWAICIINRNSITGVYGLFQYVVRNLHYVGQGRKNAVGKCWQINSKSLLLQEVFKQWGIHKTRITPLHPQSDGMVKKIHHNYKRVLAQGRSIRHKLPHFVLAYRAITHNITRMIAIKRIFKRQLLAPCQKKKQSQQYTPAFLMSPWDPPTSSSD